MGSAMRSPVVVGVDGSDSALRAVRWAAAYAARHGFPLRLVHVYLASISLPGGVFDQSVVRRAMRTQGRKWLRDARMAAAETVPENRLAVTLRSAPVVPALVEESRAAALVVLGTRGLGGFSGLLLGSTGSSLAGRAHCPLVVVRGDGSAPEQGPVVVGVDGTQTSEPAIAFAFAEAAARDRHLVAVHAWTEPALDTVLLGRTVSPPDFEPAQQAAYEVLAERLAGWQEKYPEVRVTREVVRDHPWRALLRHADAAALVVVGTRGRGGFRGLVLGSTSQRLLHHAPCPVAVVRSEVDEQR
jgi:nucleotide-binding universal stress UspA family protein